MRVSTVVSVSDIVKSIAPFAVTADKVARIGTKLRFYVADRLEGSNWPTGAIIELLDLNYKIKVYYGNFIWTSTLLPSGKVFWETRRTPKTRNYMVVEVSL